MFAKYGSLNFTSGLCAHITITSTNIGSPRRTENEHTQAAQSFIQGDSVPREPKLLSMYTVEQRGFLIRKYWQTGSFKACQTAFRTEFGERRAPWKC